MKAIFNNILDLDQTAINTPFMIEETPIGVILDVNNKMFTVEIWDRYCGYEFNKKPHYIRSVYLSTKEQDIHSCVSIMNPIKCGKWERIINPYGELEGFIHNECGFSSMCAFNYCPSCGTEMS